MRKLKIGKNRITQYTVKDLMEVLDISKVTALKLLNSGQLNSIRIGRQHWINEDDLIKFLRASQDRHPEAYEEILHSKFKNPITRSIVKRLLK